MPLEECSDRLDGLVAHRPESVVLLWPQLVTDAGKYADLNRCERASIDQILQDWRMVRLGIVKAAV